jgi:hypothetical protein
VALRLALGIGCAGANSTSGRYHVFGLGVGRPRIRNNVHFSSFPLFGKWPRRAFGDSLKVPSEVNMQCFFRLVRYHFDASNHEISRTADKQLIYLNSDSLRSPSSSPSPERIDERSS